MQISCFFLIKIKYFKTLNCFIDLVLFGFKNFTWKNINYSNKKINI